MTSEIAPKASSRRAGNDAASIASTVPPAKLLAPKANAILVFPTVTKAGLGVGGQYGEGTLLKGGKAVGYYKTTGASFGLQSGGQ